MCQLDVISQELLKTEVKLLSGTCILVILLSAVPIGSHICLVDWHNNG